ncbi:MAG: adenylate/guanylate cyclase domain-containing protein [Marmoricola sp.]
MSDPHDAAENVPGDVPVDVAGLHTQLERAVLGEPRELTADEVSVASDLPLDLARRLWRALGFPDAAGTAAFTVADVEALKAVAAARDLGLDEDALVAMTRAVGSTMSRLADWEVGNLLAATDDGFGRHGGGSQGAGPHGVDLSVELVARTAEVLDTLLVHAWRRHLAVAIARAEPLQVPTDEVTTTATVGFADLVNFTALSNELDEDEIGDLVEVFESRCHDVVAEHGGRVVKSLGDSVLFWADSATEGVDIGLDIIGVIGGDQRLPDVRVGVATGPAVLRMGDLYGPGVNLAARLTTVARRNRAIIDHATAGLLPPADFDVRTLPARPLRGFGDVEPITVRRTRPRHGAE